MPRRTGLLPLEVDILEVAAHEDAVHGFGIARTLRERHGRNLVAHGTLYKALGRLVVQGLLERWWEPAEAAEADGRPRRRLYRVTDAGRAALAAGPRVRGSSSEAVAPDRRGTVPAPPSGRPGHGLPGTVTP